MHVFVWGLHPESPHPHVLRECIMIYACIEPEPPHAIVLPTLAPILVQCDVCPCYQAGPHPDLKFTGTPQCCLSPAKVKFCPQVCSPPMHLGWPGVSGTRVGCSHV